MDLTAGEREARSGAALTALRQHARDIVDGRAEPYAAGREMWGEAMSASGQGRDGSHCYVVWLLWGALTDWAECKPAETVQAEAAMRRAAAEWLEVADDESRWRPFFDRWLYDEMGYERKSPQSIYVELLDEGVEVWRPVDARVEAGAVFRLPDTAAPDEHWRFPPGSRVRCEWRELSDGFVLSATELAD